MTNFLIFCFLALSFGVFVSGEGCGENCNCGISKNIGYFEGFNDGNGGTQNRILGGKNSDPSDWPFIAFVDGCTGSIIGDRWILSAAHCLGDSAADFQYDDDFNGTTTTDASVDFDGSGSGDGDGDNEDGDSYDSYDDANENVTLTVTINGKEYGFEQIIVHKDYDGETLLNDIYLIKLNETIEFSARVAPVCLFRNLTVPEMEVGAAAGYGIRFIRVKNMSDTYIEGPLNDTSLLFEPNTELRETPVLIRSLDFCNIEDSETQVCAGGANRGTTQGDSGGPLVVIRDHHWVQYGVTSYGNYLAIPGDLLAVSDQGIYTKVPAYCDWIAEKTSQEVTCQ